MSLLASALCAPARPVGRRLTTSWTKGLWRPMGVGATSAALPKTTTGSVPVAHCRAKASTPRTPGGRSGRPCSRESAPAQDSRSGSARLPSPPASPPRARRKSSLSNASWARSGSRCRSVWCARNKTTMVSNRLRAQKVVQTSRNRSTHSSSPQTGTNVDTVSCETSFARMSVMPKERRSPTAWDMKKTPIDRKVKRMEGPMMSTV
mmetsp:Transcript_17958/g.55567  ORF Transcript_17958/g.55567 Transcript_17958/m.55567 type:complete len:206 (-) Transcript_17958:772-1389(-)